jgi:hypothetical protein
VKVADAESVAAPTVSAAVAVFVPGLNVADAASVAAPTESAALAV